MTVIHFQRVHYISPFTFEILLPLSTPLSHNLLQESCNFSRCPKKVSVFRLWEEGKQNTSRHKPPHCVAFAMARARFLQDTTTKPCTMVPSRTLRSTFQQGCMYTIVPSHCHQKKPLVLLSFSLSNNAEKERRKTRQSDCTAGITSLGQSNPWQERDNRGSNYC